ncbi:MAG: DoxX family protein [Saprospiraceae bacterium]|nr:DoxX family protein [Saprospiraceae bacterium]
MNIHSVFNLSLVLRLLVALIYLQTLYFKFSAHPDSVYIFSKLGMEPWGRIGIGIAELVTSILLLVPQTKLYGILLSLAVISGAIFSHLGPLGIQVQGDSGKVFYLAVLVFLFSALLVWLHRTDFKLLWKQMARNSD